MWRALAREKKRYSFRTIAHVWSRITDNYQLLWVTNISFLLVWRPQEALKRLAGMLQGFFDLVFFWQVIISPQKKNKKMLLSTFSHFWPKFSETAQHIASSGALNNQLLTGSTGRKTTVSKALVCLSAWHPKFSSKPWLCSLFTVGSFPALAHTSEYFYRKCFFVKLTTLPLFLFVKVFTVTKSCGIFFPPFREY